MLWVLFTVVAGVDAATVVTGEVAPAVTGDRPLLLLLPALPGVGFESFMIAMALFFLGVPMKDPQFITSLVVSQRLLLIVSG